MKAIQIAKTGGPEVLEYVEIPTPTPAAGQVLVRIEASGVNFIDTYLREGRYPAALPFVPGQEAAGIVAAIGEGVTGWVVEHRSVVALPENAAADRRFKRFQALIEDTYEAFLSVPLVSRGDVIGVINVHHREPHYHDADEIALLTFVGEQMGGAIAKSVLEEANARLQEETAEMRRQLETRKLVERAKGILQYRHSLTEEEAYLRLRNESRRLRRPMRELAEAIILSEDLSRKSEAYPQ